MAHKKEDWLILQKKIFTRWVNQKLAPRGLSIKDVVEDISARVIVDLLEILSEIEFTGKKPSAEEKSRLRILDNLNGVLDYAYKKIGIELELKCSSENIADHEEKPVLAFIWAIMKKFMTFGDQEEKLSAKDALQMWVANQVHGYKGVKIENFGKSFHDGLALCALVHRFRPKLINFDSLNPSNKEENLKIAFAAAEKYFGLEQYLQPTDIWKLDEKSMLVYISEYFYGIAAQRKLDLAARRIHKLILLTQINDNLKIDYNSKALKLKEQINKVMSVLNERTVDNTMAGAKKKLEEFYDYKTKEKGAIIGNHLSVEAVYNLLAMRLAEHKRPAFVPDNGQTLKDLTLALKALDECEAERNVALHHELNRQNRLLQDFTHFNGRYNKLKAWIDIKRQYLGNEEQINSIGTGQFHLNRLSAYNEESQSTYKSGVPVLESFSSQLEQEKFENILDVQNKLNEIKKSFEELEALAITKKKVLDDALDLEIRKEKSRILFAGLASSFNSWCKDTIESIESTHFGFELKEVTIYGNKITEEDTTISTAVSSKFSECEKAFSEGKAIGVVENVYTQQTVESLSNAGESVKQALSDRNKRYQTELNRHQANDNMCSQFANKADPFAKMLLQYKSHITDSKDSLEGQLAYVKERIASEAKDGADLTDIQNLQSSIDAANIQHNRHSLHTAKDLDLQWTQYLSFLNQKKTQLEEEIEHKRLRGVTPQQYAEIKQQFKQFDKNGNGYLDRNEFKACLYSLGDERPRSEVDKIMQKYVAPESKNGIAYEGFQEFMITQLGDNDTLDEIVQGFKLINKGADVGNDELMGLLLNDEDLKYLHGDSTAPIDFTAWTNAVFAR